MSLLGKAESRANLAHLARANPQAVQGQRGLQLDAVVGTVRIGAHKGARVVAQVQLRKNGHVDTGVALPQAHKVGATEVAVRVFVPVRTARRVQVVGHNGRNLFSGFYPGGTAQYGLDDSGKILELAIDPRIFDPPARVQVQHAARLEKVHSSPKSRLRTKVVLEFARFPPGPRISRMKRPGCTWKSVSLWGLFLGSVAFLSWAWYRMSQISRCDCGVVDTDGGGTLPDRQWCQLVLDCSPGLHRRVSLYLDGTPCESAPPEVTVQIDSVAQEVVPDHTVSFYAGGMVVLTLVIFLAATACVAHHWCRESTRQVAPRPVSVTELSIEDGTMTRVESLGDARPDSEEE